MVLLKQSLSCQIAHICHAKLLGVKISQDLTWNKHLGYIVKNVSKRLYISVKACRDCTKKDLVTVYINVVRPVLGYVCTV